MLRAPPRSAEIFLVCMLSATELAASARCLIFLCHASLQGKTHIASFDSGLALWAHPLALQLRAVQGAQAWPRLLLKVFGLHGSLQHFQGYALCSLPSTPGCHELKVPCWRVKHHRSGLADDISSEHMLEQAARGLSVPSHEGHMGLLLAALQVRADPSKATFSRWSWKCCAMAALSGCRWLHRAMASAGGGDICLPG